MKTSEALQLINKAYVPGIVAHYAKQNPDLWQRAHDEWEKSFSHSDDQVRDSATQAFVDRCLELIDRFKRDCQPQKPGLSDALNLDGNRFDAARSVRTKECASCRKSAALRIVRLGPSALDGALLGDECKIEDIPEERWFEKQVAESDARNAKRAQETG